MASKFDEPKAKEALTRLRECLLEASSYSPAQGPLNSPHPFLEITDLVEILQPYLGRKRPDPVPFWKCVIALDKARPKLRLAATVTGVFERIGKIPQGPLTRLIKMANGANRPFSVAEEQLIEKLRQHMENTPNDAPSNIEDYFPILSRVESNAIKSFGRGYVFSSLMLAERKALAWVKFLDFYRSHRIWIDAYQETLETALHVASILQNEDFMKLLRNISYGLGCHFGSIAKDRAAMKATIRQAKRRKKANHREIKRRKKPNAGEIRLGDWSPNNGN